MKNALKMQIGIAATAWGLLANPAAAQQAPDPEVVANEEDVVIVTARKREETLQEVPVSLSVFSNEELNNLGVRDIVDVALFTPGFAMQSISGGVEQPFIRGMSSTSFDRNEQTASFFQDGAYSSGLGRTLLPGDIERIEVIKGPQAALFGRATFAGAINYITKKPTDEFEGQARVAAGEFGRLDTFLGVSGPIVRDKLLFRLSAGTERYDGEFRNTLVDNQTLGEINRSTVNGWLTLLPTDTLSADLRISRYWKRDDAQVPGYIQPSTLNNCFEGQYFCGTVISDRGFLGLNLDRVGGGFSDTDQLRSTLDINWDIGRMTLTSQTMLMEQESSTWFDGDYTATPVFGTQVNGTNDNVSQEIRLTSPAEDRVNFIVGGYYFKEDSTSELGAFGTSEREVETRALFGSVGIAVTDRFELSFDARYQEEDQTFVSRGGQTFDISTDSFLPRVIAQFEASDQVNLYASASKGSNPARFNASTNVPDDQLIVDEEQIWSYEVGIKTQFWGGKATFNAAAYHIDWNDQAYRIEIVGNDGEVVNIFDNLGGSSINGLELDGSLTLDRYNTLIATFAYVDATYDDFLSPNALRVFGDAQVAGNELPNTPNTTATISYMHRRPFPLRDNSDVYFRADHSYRSAQFISELNEAESPDLNLLNLRAGVEAERTRIEFAVTNVLDDDSPLFATRFTDFGRGFPSRFAPLVSLRPGRQAEVRLTYNF